MTRTVNLGELDGTDGFALAGGSPYSLTGTAVAGAGDVNGDGFGDILVTAPTYGVLVQGAAYIVFGKASGFGPALDLNFLNGKNGYRLLGISEQNRIGYAAAGAADIDGDGFIDILIGAERYDGLRGEVYVIPSSRLASLDAADGAADGLIDLYSAPPAIVTFLEGSEPGDYAGSAIATGDINGDGFDDTVVTAPITANSALRGSAYVVFGAAGGPGELFPLSALDGANGFRIDGVDGSFFGTTAATADINGDGLDDVLLSENSLGVGYSSSVTVLYGSTAAYPAVIQAVDQVLPLGLSIFGKAGAEGGKSVAAPGDVNGDGIEDILIGSQGVGDFRGEAYLVFGGQALADLDAADGVSGGGLQLDNLGPGTGATFVISGAAGDEQSLGKHVAAAGDVNGDGFADVLISDGGGDGAQVWVVFGGRRMTAADRADGAADGVVDLALLGARNGFKIAGLESSELSLNIASAGDVNGDGFGDVVVGSDIAAPGGLINAGAAHVVFGIKPTAAVSRAGTSASQAIAGGFGNDELSGRGGDDRLRGHEGDDRLDGGSGDDKLAGEAGADRFIVSAGDDAMDGGDGLDTIDLGSATPVLGQQGIAVDLTRLSFIHGGGTVAILNIERIGGTVGADALTGNARGNALRGRGGDDVLEGGFGVDRLSGDGGADVLSGGLGADRLSGGGAADRYLYRSQADSTVAEQDLITGFDSEADVIDLELIGLDFEFIGSAEFTAAEQVRVSDTAEGAIVEVNITGASQAEMAIRLAGVTAAAIGAEEFIL